MTHPIPAPLLDPRDLGPRTLVLAAGAVELGALLAGPLGELAVGRREAGDEVRLVALADGETGELRAAVEERGLTAPAPGSHPVGGLGSAHHLAQELEELLAELDPALVLTGVPAGDATPDQHAAFAALAAALAASGARRLLLAGWGGAPPVGTGLVAFGEERLLDVPAAHALAVHREHAGGDGPRTTAVLSSFNKRDDVRANLRALRAQTRPFADVVVVDNASGDGSAAMVAAEFPEVTLVVMPHSAYGACETFNIGFASATTERIAILDDDVVLPPEWLEKTSARMDAEPETTAVVSTKIVEPGMPESYARSEAINRERYMSTFRGCASLARRDALARAGWYDERLFIYGNERDLTCRLLNLGYRVLQYPGVETFHKTPFGVQMGKRSLYYHARNAWLGMLKYAPLEDLLRMPVLVVTKVLFRGSEGEQAGEVTDATGTIGIGRAVRETPGAWWILVKALASVIANVPYCMKRREPCTAEDFELPLQ